MACRCFLGPQLERVCQALHLSPTLPSFPLDASERERGPSLISAYSDCSVHSAQTGQDYGIYNLYRYSRSCWAYLGQVKRRQFCLRLGQAGSGRTRWGASKRDTFEQAEEGERDSTVSRADDKYGRPAQPCTGCMLCWVAYIIQDSSKQEKEAHTTALAQAATAAVCQQRLEFKLLPARIVPRRWTYLNRPTHRVSALSRLFCGLGRGLLILTRVVQTS